MLSRKIFYKFRILMASTAILGAYIILTILEVVLKILFGIILIIVALNYD